MKAVIIIKNGDQVVRLRAKIPSRHFIEIFRSFLREIKLENNLCLDKIIQLVEQP